MADKLTEMFYAQLNLQKRLGFKPEAMTPQERTIYIKEYTLHAEHELHEMLQELPYFKAWKKYPYVDFEKAKEEFADVLHFILNIAIGLGMTDEDIHSAYMEKNLINHGRQNNTAAYKPCKED